MPSTPILKQRHLQAVQLLIDGMSAAEITETLRLRRTTLRRWQQMPDFQQEYAQRLQEAQNGIRRQLLGMANPLIEAMKSELGDSSDTCDKRIQAALNALKLLETGAQTPETGTIK